MVTCGYVATMIAKSSIFYRVWGSPAAEVSGTEARDETRMRTRRGSFDGAFGGLAVPILTKIRLQDDCLLDGERPDDSH